MHSINEEWGVYVDLGIGDPASPSNNLDGKDYARYTPVAVTRLADAPEEGVALPRDAHHAFFFVLTNPISVRVGSEDATADEGGVFPAGTILKIEGQRAFLENVSFIDTAAGASEVRILYGRRV